MSDFRQQLPPRQTLFLILVPLLGTFLCQRLYLHLVRVQHVYPGGRLVHHLFFGVLLVIPAAFVLAFGTRHAWQAISALVALGIGSAMVLDEITYLVATRGSDADYVSSVSLVGAIILISLATLLLLFLYRRHRQRES